MADEEKADKKEPVKKSFVPFFEQGANIHMSLKVSKDGLEREEDTEVLKGMYDELKPFKGGFPLIEALEEQKERFKSSKAEQ